MADLELPILEPPPGGLAKLRERLDADQRRRRFAIPAFAIAAVTVAIVVWLASRRPPSAESVPSVAAKPLPDPSVSNDVAFYWVSPSASAPSTPSPSVVDISAVSITP
jgi:hypothetical protein